MSNWVQFQKAFLQCKQKKHKQIHDANGLVQLRVLRSGARESNVLRLVMGKASFNSSCRQNACLWTHFSRHWPKNYRSQVSRSALPLWRAVFLCTKWQDWSWDLETYGLDTSVESLAGWSSTEKRFRLKQLHSSLMSKTSESHRTGDGIHCTGPADSVSHRKLQKVHLKVRTMSNFLKECKRACTSSNCEATRSNQDCLDLAANIIQDCCAAKIPSRFL